MERIIILGLLFVKTITMYISAQVYLHDFGTTTISTHPYTVAPGAFDSNITSSSWTNSTGSWTSFTGSTGQAIALSNSGGTPEITLTFSINSGCNLDITSFNFWRQRSSTGAQNWSMTINGTNAGSGTIPTTGAFIGTTNVSGFSGLTGTVTIVISLSGASGTGTFRLDDFTLNGSTSCNGGNTITTGTITGAPFSVGCSTIDSGTIAFTSTGTFNGGNTFTAQLSDASGSFSNPTNLTTSVSMSGDDPSGTIHFTIPAQTPTGTAYRIRIISSNPTAISDDNGTDINITLTETCIAPHVTSVIINSCNSLCSEGDNELLFGNTGDYSVDFTSSNLDIYYGTSPSPTTNYTQTVHDNPSATEEFNLNAGCPGLFVDAYNTTVPANSSFVIANVDVCPLDVIDFTNLCGNGPIYVIYVDASAWQSSGNFANSTSCGSGGFRYFQSSITTTLNTNHVIDFYYECALNTGSDGDYAVWDENGGAALLQGNNGCAFPAIVLPTELISFTGENYGSQSLLNWVVASEHNNNYYSVYHSKDGGHFDLIAQISGAGNSHEELSYQFIHSRPANGINYYKLTSTDFDGSTYFKGIVAVMINSLGTYLDPVTNELKFPEKGNYEIYSLEGKLLGNVEQSFSFPILNKGIVLIRHIESGTIERLFIP